MTDHTLTASEIAELVEYAKALEVTTAKHYGWYALTCHPCGFPLVFQQEREEEVLWRRFARWLHTGDGALWGLARTRELLGDEYADAMMSIDVQPQRALAAFGAPVFGKPIYDGEGPTFGLALCRACMAALRAAGRVTG